MSVIVYEGVPGSGKTMDFMVRFFFPALMAWVAERDEFTKIPTGRKFRRPIFTNIEGLNYPMIAELSGLSLDEVRDQVHEVKTAADWKTLLVHDREDTGSLKIQHLKYALIAVDEAQMIYPKGDFRNTPQGFYDFLAWHRHISADVIFLTQFANGMVSQISEICDRCYSVKNLGFISGLVGGVYVIHVREKPRQPNYATLKGRYQKKYFGTYASNQGGEAFKLAVPNAVGGVLAAAVFGSIAFLAVHFYSHGLFGGGRKAVKNVPSPLLVGVAPGVVRPQVVAAGLKDSLNDRQGVNLPSSAEAAGLLTPAEAALSGHDPKKSCYVVPVRSTWVIEYPHGVHGKKVETVRGWKEGTKVLCL